METKITRSLFTSIFLGNSWNSLTFPWLFSFFFNFPDYKCNTLTFPWPGIFFIFQNFFPDRGNPVLLFITCNVHSYVRMVTGYVDSIFKAQCGILMTLKLALTSFWIHCRIFISKNILFLSINLDLKHAQPNFSKIFKNNTVLVTKYLNLHWNIVKSLLFNEKVTDFI